MNKVDYIHFGIDFYLDSKAVA